MKNTFGSSLSVTIFGESHGMAVGAVLDGMAPGIPVDEAFIAHQLYLRRPETGIGTARREQDRAELVSGVFKGKTTGTPLCVLIRSTDARSADYEATRALARPGHADYTAHEKYHGFEDYRGGGHFSGRLTAPLAAVGAIALTALRGKGIHIGTHISRCAGVSDRGFGDLSSDLAALSDRRFAVLDEARGEAMRAAILSAAAEGDSVGGVLETAVTGLPAGIGEPWFDTLEGVLAHILFAIPAVKGVEFGAGFAAAELRGSEDNDAFYRDGDAIRTKTNHSGGINGGISNGMPLLFRCAVKPTPSIAKPQETVNLTTGKSAELSPRGRHDPAIVPRARVAVDSAAALALCDMLALRYGTDWLAEKSDL